MKIVYLSQHFPPEIGAAQGRTYDMSTNLSNLGHDLHVLTTFPNSQPIKKVFEKEKVNDLTVYRSFRIRDTKKSSIRRLANYLSFMCSSFLSGLFVKKPDIIYATSPQLFQGVTGYLLSKVHRTSFVFEIRDLWVDFAELLGQFKNKKLLNLARRLETFLYKKADLLVVVTKGYKDRLISLGILEEKIIVIPNGVNPHSLKPLAPVIDIRKEYDIGDKFLVLYTGNIGAAQGLQTVIDAAEKVKDDASIVFMLIGEGVERENLVKQVKERKLPNVMIFHARKKEELSSFYAAADIGIVSLKKHPLFEITIPSKLFDYMAVSLPVLIGVNGEAREIVEKQQAGYFYEPENTDDFIRAVYEAKHDQAALTRMKNNLHSVLLHSFNREELADKLSDEFKKLAKRNGKVISR